MVLSSKTHEKRSSLSESVGPLVREFGRHVVGFLYPGHCALCRTALPEPNHQSSSDFCDDCRRDLLSDAGAACERCGAPIGPFVDPAAGCNDCLRGKFAFERVIRLGTYNGVLRNACLRAKQKGQEELTAALARLMWDHRTAPFQETPIDLIVAVPHFWLQRLFRSHNPAETLAGVWAHVLKVPYHDHILRKAKWTKPQRSLPASQRRKNIRRAFKVRRTEEIADATVLLVDDIMTTGATANEAARVLKRAGAARVITAVVARTVRQ